jgi:hypothetical protein
LNGCDTTRSHAAEEGGDQFAGLRQKLADELIREYPREGFAEELAKTNIRDWAEESVQISLKTVYRNLDPEITTFADMPAGYEADAIRVARRRAALAWYRLAEELKRLYRS